jgi:DNA repair protein RecN (Recombination protein N)
MLTHIIIRDLAIVDHVELSLDKGMSVLTGETGAGKSILVDALGLVLGDRADSDSVRHGCKRAEVNAGFNVGAIPQAKAWLEERELDDGEDCLLRRTIAAEGRSKGFINGTPVTMQALRELGEFLVDIHGQHEHQSLMRTDMQTTLLDAYADDDTLLKAVSTAWQAWHDTQTEYDRLRAAAADRTAKLDLLRFQVNELEALAPVEGEFHELETEHARLANLGKLQEGVQEIIDALDENEQAAASTLVARSALLLQDLGKLDDELATNSNTLNEALAGIDDVVKELRSYRDSLESEPGRFETVETRMGALLDTARKHHIEADQLPALFEKLSQELDTLDDADNQLDLLRDRIEGLAADYDKQANKLSARRKTAAKQLADTVSEHMQTLGMPGGRFDITLIAQASRNKLGMERAEFLVSANPGQPPKSLTKVASGGELSRISLAIQVAAANTTGIPVLVFDEVDVGIGGGVAEIVGRQLHKLASNRQVLCVTHLPQVASQANHHLNVSKSVTNGQTSTAITPLENEARTEEIARMLGGVDITEQTLAHAREMLGVDNKKAG